LFHDSKLVVQAPDVLDLEALVGTDDFVSTLHKIEELQLNRIFSRHFVTLDHYEASRTLPAAGLISEIGGEYAVADRAPLADFGDVRGHTLSQFELGQIPTMLLFHGIQYLTGAQPLVQTKDDLLGL